MRTILRKVLMLMTLYLGLAGISHSQTFLWESFDAGQMPPSGWTIDGLPAQWSVANSNTAGGTAPEAKFTYVQGTSITRLITPQMDLTGLTEVKLSFRHFYDDYTGAGPKAGVATRSGGGAWNTVWEINPTSNVGPEKLDIVISNSDVGKPDFQICFYLNGNMYNIDYWYLDDILIFNPLNLDAALTGLSGTPSYFGGPAPVKGNIMNMGLTQIQSVEIMWKLDDGATYSTLHTGLSINTQQTFSFTSNDLMEGQIGPHVLGVWIHQVNGLIDDSQTNDTASKEVYRVSHVVEKTPLFEEFTSSTCSPCASFNTGFVPWCEQHEDDITLVKYQMNWPGSGDPYYTLEGGVRKDYYGVGFVPDLFCDGANVATSMPAVQTAFDYASTQPGLMDIAASHTLAGKVIQVQGSVLPFAGFNNCRVHIVVMEKVTHNNVASNGETSFHHVMMKMIPDAYGTTVNFSDRVPFTFDQTMDLNGTNVEEWDDLIVAVFVQNQNTKEVYQSVYSVENGVFNTEARLSDIQLDGTSLTGFNPDIFTYDVVLPVGTSVAPTLTGIPIDPAETVIVVPTYTLPGTSTIDVFAEDLSTHNLYSVNFFMSGIGMGEGPMSSIVTYPNPSNGQVTILGAEGAEISVLSPDGKILMNFAQWNARVLDLNSLTAGIYLLRIEQPDGRTITRRLTLVK